MKAFEFVFDMSKRVVKLAAAFLMSILRALHALVSTICRLFGVTPPAMPQPFVPSTTPDDVRDEYRDAYTREISNGNALTYDVGAAVHQYASQPDPSIRGAVDLGGLSPAQLDWLLGLKEADLKRLAQAGPKACDFAVSGKRCGIVGLPMPSGLDAIEVAPTRDRLADRIGAMKRLAA